MPTATLLPGTLDLLVLKAASLGAEHGYGLLLRIQRASRGALAVEQGALYPALFRLESQGLIEAEWGLSDNNRKAKYYTLTRSGRARLARDLDDWHALVQAMDAVLGATRNGLIQPTRNPAAKGACLADNPCHRAPQHPPPPFRMGIQY